jgi:hypothetical protein
MKFKAMSDRADERRYVLVLDPGEEAVAAITRFAATQKLRGSSLTALGAFERADIGWFDLAEKTYRKIEVAEQCEALSLVGDVATGDDGKPSLHVHAVLGLRDGSTRGGHLMSGVVRPTLEVMISESPVALRRKKRPELGIALIDIS